MTESQRRVRRSYVRRGKPHPAIRVTVGELDALTSICHTPVSSCPGMKRWLVRRFYS